jgi:hypothetical protein
MGRESPLAKLVSDLSGTNHLRSNLNIKSGRASPLWGGPRINLLCVLCQGYNPPTISGPKSPVAPRKSRKPLSTNMA